MERLQRVLAYQGHVIDAAEKRKADFGPSTLAALQALQADRGLTVSEAVDQTTLSLLLEAEATMPRPKDHASSTPAHRGLASGRYADGDGEPVAGVVIVLVEKRLDGDRELGRGVTDKAGRYAIHYPRSVSLSLAVRAEDPAGAMLAQSPTLFRAAASVDDLDLTSAADGVMRNPSRLSVLRAAVIGELGDTPLESLKQDKDHGDLNFLAQATDWQFNYVASLYMARILAPTMELDETTLFALFSQGLPPALSRGLAQLPEAGIDETFMTHVKNGLVPLSHGVMEQSLQTAVKANAVPASYGTRIQAELTRLDVLRVQMTADAPYVRGKASLKTLLEAGGIDPAVRTAFIQAYADAGKNRAETWRTLRADQTRAGPALVRLRLVLNLGDVLGGNMMAVKDTLRRIDDGEIKAPSELALMDEADWTARAREFDPEAQSIAQYIPGQNAEQRHLRYGKAVAGRLAKRYPTSAFAGALARAPTSSFAAKDEMVALIKANPGFNLARTRIDQFVANGKLAVSPEAVRDLKTAQRLHRILPEHRHVEALHGAGLTSAQAIYFKGRGPFVVQMADSLGGEAIAKKAFAQAHMAYGAALAAFGKYNLALNGVTTAALPSAKPDVTTLEGLPDLQALFGSLDYFACDDCQSVFSPAAYLVDLLQYLAQFKATPSPNPQSPYSVVTNARDALFQRRWELPYTALSCNNSEITIPYIDLVNELLETAIGNTDIPGIAVYETTGTIAERRALPQVLSPDMAAAAYANCLATLVGEDQTLVPTAWPLSLPFDLAFARTTAYIAALGTTRTALLSLFPDSTAGAPMTGAGLGINATRMGLIDEAETIQPWIRWNLTQNPTFVIDPKTRQPYPPPPTDWVAALNKVPVLLNRANITLQQLYQLLEATWVTQGQVTLQLGTQTIGSTAFVSPDTELMTFTGLTADVLDRANRFLRLWMSTGLQMWELDWALGQSESVLDDTFLSFLAGAITVQGALGLPFQEVLTFWGPIETRDVVSHLGDEDVLVPSTYRKIFASPTMLVSWSDLFADPTTLSGAPILAGAGAAEADLRPLNGVGAALGLSADDIGVILVASGAANILSLPTLAVLVRYARLAAGLSLAVQDLILWLTLADAEPFDLDPQDNTLEAIRRIGVLQGLGIAPRDLDYLLRDRSATQSALAVTASAAPLLQSVRDAVAKAVAVNALAVTGISNTAPIKVTTASSHGLAPGDTVLIFGVTGNTAANGAFTITVTTSTAFTLDGSTGSGAWAGDGTVTTDLAGAIQTVVIAAVAAATGVSADVTTPVLNAIGLLPLDPATITALVAETQVDPTQFPTLGAAFVRAAKAAALFTALGPSPADFAFTISQAGNFGWLNPATLPTTATVYSNYEAFESLLQALKLQARQTARTPKLFDVFAAWTQPGGLPTDVASAISGPFATVASASVGTPIAITTTAAHGFSTGIQVTVTGVQSENTGGVQSTANGTFTITVTGPTTFTLDGSKGNGTSAAGGTVAAVGAPSLAQALNASVADVTAIASGLGIASPPHLAGLQSAGTLAYVGGLTMIADALDVAARYGLDAATLLVLASPSPNDNSAAAAMGALQAQHPQSAWLAAVQPVEDTLRQQRRDALLAYLLIGPLNGYPETQFLTVDDVYDYYLIDPLMGPGSQTTRLLQASLAIQQFVNQSFLGLSIGATVDMTDARWSEWSWRQQYRLWQANRQVFLYPENYVLPQTRTDASPFFADLESDVRQGNLDAAAAEAAFLNYLRSLVSVANLEIMAEYNEERPDGSQVLHVFGRTRGTPAHWFYRTRTRQGLGAGVWSAWTPLNMNIVSDQVIPVIWDQRLCLLWPIFNQISTVQTTQSVPAGGVSAIASDPPMPITVVQMAMSEFSAGQWQPSRVFDQKMYFNAWPQSNWGRANGFPNLDRTSTAPLDFRFTAREDGNYNLVVQVFLYWFYLGGTATLSQTQFQLATATIAAPDAPMVVTQYFYGPEYSQNPAFNIFPMEVAIDASQEPSYLNVYSNSASQPTAVPLEPPFTAALTNPYYLYVNYRGKGQNLTYIQVVNIGQMWVQQINARYASPSSVSLLNSSPFTDIIVPQQEEVWDSSNPFFLTSSGRTYLVQPHFFSIANSPQELETFGSFTEWTTTYEFQTFYHPYARTFLRELEIGGISQLMSRNLQTAPQAVRGWPGFDFNGYQPQANVVKPVPGDGAADPGEAALDFRSGSAGAYSLYNWELFYHAPMFVASLLTQNQQFQPAMQWLEYIFNPTDSSTQPSPQRYWQTAPFNAMAASNWLAQQINTLMESLDTGAASEADTEIAAWLADPFDPHRIASLRISAYGKATVMAFLDNLIAWGDSLYAQYTAETVSQAEQLYVLADLLLGPAPDQVRMPAPTTQAPPSTYHTLQSIDLFSNALVAVENLIVAPEAPQSLVNGDSPPTLPQLPATSSGLLFCIPPNDQLLAYWGTVEGRLDNIRAGLNLQGMAVPLPLYAAPINPLLLIAAQAAGGGIAGGLNAAPLYRFSVYIRKATELANEVRSFAALILSALEKQDSENLATLRATQEVNIQTLMLDVTTGQLKEAQDQVTALQNQLAVTQIRYNYYSTIAYMNAWEIAAEALQQDAINANQQAVGLNQEAALAHLIPELGFGANGIGGTPLSSFSFGGGNIAGSAGAWAAVAGNLASIAGEQSSIAATTGGYQRRQDDWTLQANLADAELTQIQSQIVAAQDRIAIVTSTLKQQTTAIANAQAISDFLTNKYTNAQLYNWMISQLTTVYAQAYQLAFSVALQAQSAYQYELGRPLDQFIGLAYWDSQHKGLTAGESLLFDLRRMESQYLVNNLREQEVTRHVSLALTQPQALVALLQTGSCPITLDESLFDLDHPGHYFRRLRSVAVTIPCVTGPYTGVNATLILGQSVIRTAPPSGGYTPYSWADGPSDDSNVGAAPPSAAISNITISSGQNDSGLFDADLRDERWLPFEGQGAVSTWALTLDPRDNAFDLTSVTDVVLHIRYTARTGGDVDAVRTALTPLKPPVTPIPADQIRGLLVSARDTFGDAYYSFFNPSDAAATDLILNLPISSAIFPYSNLGSPSVAEVAVIMGFVQPMPAALVTVITGNTAMAATFGPTGAATPQTVSLAAVSATAAPGGGPVAALSTGALTLAGAAPGPLTLTLPIASIPEALQVKVDGEVRLDSSQVSDILFLITYQLA